jgi:hypothetical protein
MQVIDVMATRAMRMHHALWHTARNGWAAFSDAARDAFRERGWEPPRPALTADREVEFDNGAGEDFLFMHRQMIAEVNEILAEVGDPQHPRVEGWSSIPDPDDVEYPVPPPFTVPRNPQFTESIRSAKSQESLDQIREWETLFTDPAFLRRVTTVGEHRLQQTDGVASASCRLVRRGDRPQSIALVPKSSTSRSRS